MFLLWYCFDDTLARVLETPGLGNIPLWVAFLMALPSILIGIIDVSWQ